MNRSGGYLLGTVPDLNYKSTHTEMSYYFTVFRYAFVDYCWAERTLPIPPFINLLKRCCKIVPFEFWAFGLCAMRVEPTWIHSNKLYTLHRQLRSCNSACWRKTLHRTGASML